MAKMSRSEEVCGSPSRIATNEVSGRSDDGKPASEPHANPASPAADGKLDPASLADKIDALAEKATKGPWECLPEKGAENFANSIYAPLGAFDGLLLARVDQNGATNNAALIVELVNARETLTRALRDAERMREALVQHNDRLRSAQQIASREGADTNWKSFRGAVTYTLAEYHELVNECRQALGDNT